MTWPWVSRLAYDEVVQQRNDLRLIRDRLTDEIIRMKRHEVGLRETPREVKAALQKPPEVPPEVSMLYRGRCQSSAMETEIERQASEMHAGGAPWDEVRRALVLQVGEPPQAEVQA